MNEVSTPLTKKVFLYALVVFNVLFLTYVLTVGHYNRLSIGDFLCVWAVRNYGFFNAITYWYIYWQGRFGPHFFLTGNLLLYEVTPNLFFYSMLLSSLFVYSFYRILNFYFSMSKPVLISYSILLFSALLLTTFELSTFYWMSASVMYFGGIAFALFGIVFILKPGDRLLDYVVIGLCFLYAGSSSEHVGLLFCLLLFMIFVYIFFRSAYPSSNFVSHYKNFVSSTLNKKILLAFFFCSAAFIAMILAPGTKVRMGATIQATDPIELLRKSFDSAKFIGDHIFYKLPYLVAFIPLFILFGSYLKPAGKFFQINFGFVLALGVIALLAIIFISSLPMSYAIGTIGPLRAYVYVNFCLVVILFLLCIYAGARYQSGRKSIEYLSIVSLAVLFTFVFYTFYSELPLLKRYNQADKQRMAILSEHKEQNRTEPVFLPPLHNPEYNTITDMWRVLTNTHKRSSPMTDLPIVIFEIEEKPDWTNHQLKLGLGLDFDIYLAPEEKPNEPKQ